MLETLRTPCYSKAFEFTQELTMGESFSSFINKLHYEQDKIFIEILNKCTETSKQETSTARSFDEKAFSTLRYLVEQNRKCADYILFHRERISDFLKDCVLRKDIQIKGSEELMLMGLVGNIMYTQFKTTASATTEEPIAPEVMYALSSEKNGYHTHLHISLNPETRMVTVQGRVTIAIDSASVAKLTIIKNI